MAVKWSRWYRTEEKNPEVGMFFWAESECHFCGWKDDHKAIFLGFTNNSAKTNISCSPPFPDYPDHLMVVQRWRYLIEGNEKDVMRESEKEKEKEKENA